MVKNVKFFVVMLVMMALCVNPYQVLANNQSIKVVVDGRHLVLDQPPVVQSGRTLVPLRSIFEALQAQVDFNSKTKVITAKKGSRTIELTLGSRIAKINNLIIELDVPAQVLNNRTLVPVRFVSEALGDDISYNPITREVVIMTKPSAVTKVEVRDVSDFGDGRDLEVSFVPLSDETKIDHYRIYVVKSSKAANFTLQHANSLTSSRYTVVPKGQSSTKRTLNSATLDSDGAPIIADIPYTVFVMSVSNTRDQSKNTLSPPSPTMTLTLKNRVPAITGLTVRDVSEYGDGRDLEVRFTKVQDERNLENYRVFVVRSSEASQFNLAKAKEVLASNYTTIPMSGGDITQVLSSTARDINGTAIRNDIAYRVFVMSVGNTSAGFGDSLSAASGEITLRLNAEDISVRSLTVKDVKDFGDGRDLEVSFNIPASESRVSEYRVMVVPSSVSSFNLDAANRVSASNYTVVSKNGNNRTVTLSAEARDTNGVKIRNDVAYRVFVLSVGGQANGNRNSLAAASSVITLKNNITTVAVTNVRATDISDHGGANDIQVTFNRVADETNVQEYRVMVVKAAETFDLAKANAVRAVAYTVVPKTGNHLSVTLSPSLLDTNEDIIRQDVAYKVFVLTVSNSGTNTGNALSAASSNLTLTRNVSPHPVTNVTAAVDTVGEVSTLQVGFTKPTVENIASYEIFIVKEGTPFTIANTNNVNKMAIPRTATSHSIVLNSDIKDTSGEILSSGNSYRVYILSIANGTNTTVNTLSAPSNTFQR